MNIQLLSNEPCREDAFEGHSHQHIAEQIIRVIRDDADRHIIGIEGGWGSGKSNLISLDCADGWVEKVIEYRKGLAGYKKLSDIIG